MKYRMKRIFSLFNIRIYTLLIITFFLIEYILITIKGKKNLDIGSYAFILTIIIFSLGLFTFYSLAINNKINISKLTNKLESKESYNLDRITESIKQEMRYIRYSLLLVIILSVFYFISILLQMEIDV